jgi:hypothetical protein
MDSMKPPEFLIVEGRNPLPYGEKAVILNPES